MGPVMHITEGNGLPAAGGTEADEEVGNLSPVEKLKEARSEDSKKESPRNQGSRQAIGRTHCAIRAKAGKKSAR